MAKYYYAPPNGFIVDAVIRAQQRAAFYHDRAAAAIKVLHNRKQHAGVLRKTVELQKSAAQQHAIAANFMKVHYNTMRFEFRHKAEDFRKDNHLEGYGVCHRERGYFCLVEGLADGTFVQFPAAGV